MPQQNRYSPILFHLTINNGFFFPYSKCHFWAPQVSVPQTAHVFTQSYPLQLSAHPMPPPHTAPLCRETLLHPQRRECLTKTVTKGVINNTKCFPCEPGSYSKCFPRGTAHMPVFFPSHGYRSECSHMASRKAGSCCYPLSHFSSSCSQKA